MRRTPKYMWQDYRTNEDILSELKLIQLRRKFKITKINGYNMSGKCTETD